MLPVEFGQLACLTHLDLASNGLENHLTELGQMLGRLTHLQHLELNIPGFNNDRLEQMAYQLPHLIIHTEGDHFSGSNFVIGDYPEQELRLKFHIERVNALYRNDYG